MVKRIDNLTEDQKNMISIWRDKWINIGLKTGETDWESAVEALKICYEKAGISWHNNVIYVNSPYVGAFASSITRELLKSDAVGGHIHRAVDRSVSGAVRSAVRSAVHSAVVDAVDSAVRSAVSGAVDSAVDGAVRSDVSSAVHSAVHSAVVDAVDSAVHSSVSDAIGSAVSGAVHSSVRSAVGYAVHSAVRGAVKKMKWHEWIGGQFWVGGWWGSQSFVSFFTDVCNLELDKDIKERSDAYRKLCKSCNYVWLNGSFAMICARPKSINRDDLGRLHNENGKAIEYPDGWGLYMINGHNVGEKVVMRPQEITIEEIKSEENMEKRRIMVERYGADKYLTETGAKIIDADMRGISGGGARCLIREDNGEQWFVATDGSTERVYYMSVDRGHTTCKSAHEELCGFDESLIKMEG